MGNDLLLAGEKTLAYAAVFRQGLRFGELSQFLISPHRYSQWQFEELWRYWREQGLIHSRRRPAQRPHLKKALAIRSLARLVPWIDSIWITGSVAARTAAPDDDIDFLIITDPGRLWIARFFLVGLARVLGRARTREMSQGSWKDLWCFNMWLEADRLAFSPDQQSMYTAREVIQAIPCYIRQGSRAQDLVSKNFWITRFYASGWHQKKQQIQRAQRFWPTISFSNFLSQFFSQLNVFFFTWQLSRMSAYQTREIVEEKRAFFHPLDTKNTVKQEYERICLLYGISSNA